MICEYALEPELVATWHDSERFRYFSEHLALTMMVAQQAVWWLNIPVSGRNEFGTHLR